MEQVFRPFCVYQCENTTRTFYLLLDHAPYKFWFYLFFPPICFVSSSVFLLDMAQYCTFSPLFTHGRRQANLRGMLVRRAVFTCTSVCVSRNQLFLKPHRAQHSGYSLLQRQHYLTALKEKDVTLHADTLCPSFLLRLIPLLFLGVFPQLFWALVVYLVRWYSAELNTSFCHAFQSCPVASRVQLEFETV